MAQLIHIIKKGVMAGLVAMLALSSCGDGSSLLPNVTGQSYDLLVVGEERVWRDSVGIRMKEYLAEDMPGMAQSENYFTVSFVRNEDFSGIFKPVRNILFYEIDDKKYTQGKITYTKNKWANTQAIGRITAPTMEEFEKTYEENIDMIRRYFIAAEWERAFEFYGYHKNQAAMDSVRRMFGANALIPNHLKMMNFGENFAWFSNGNLNLRQDIVIYSVPYKSQTDFSDSCLLRVRDSVMKANIPGPTEGSYMTTEYRFIPPICQPILSREGEYSVETRGIWRVEGDMMGGPFVSRTYLDAKKENLVTAEMFIYGPNQKKRTAYRQLEALISNVTFKSIDIQAKE